MEKHGATQVASPVNNEPVQDVQRPESSEPDHEKSEEPISSIEDREQPVPHLHAKTFLVVFAVCLIYFAQLINVVGAGAVSILLSPSKPMLSDTTVACPRYLYRPRRFLEECLVDFLCRNSHHGPQSSCLSSSRLLGKTMVSDHPNRIWCRWFHHSRSCNIYEYGNCR